MKLPDSFIQRIHSDLGDQAGLFLQSLDADCPVSIRINPFKSYSVNDLEKVPWCNTGFYLPERPVFTLDPLFHAGAYYVQEASSMFLEQVIQQTVDLKQSLKVLDLCAAPGGKSTHIASLISEDSLLVSNEVIRSRARILAENITKWGTPNVVVTCNDPSDFQKLTGFFDLIVIDAPCSGEGLFRKDPLAVNEWSEDNVSLCAARQRRIVADVWDALKPDGIIIYSTCTYNKQEDEDNLRWLIDEMGANPLPVDSSSFPGITPSDDLPGYHFYPHKTKGEGFFITALKKTSGSEFKPSKTKKPPLQKASSATVKEISNWISKPLSYDYWLFQEKILAFPTRWSAELMLLIDKLSIVQAGTEIGEIKAKNIIPSHPLAISSILNKTSFPQQELDLMNSLTYLKKEEIKPTLNDQYLLASYNTVPLGFLKKAGNRYNNLFPKEWRIRMDIR